MIVAYRERVNLAHGAIQSHDALEPTDVCFLSVFTTTFGVSTPGLWNLVFWISTVVCISLSTKAM